jgi:outer membrane protein assembly factor BamB
VAATRRGCDARNEMCRAVSSCLLLLVLASAARTAENWPDFRGPLGDGHGIAEGLPLTWSETEHIAWKVTVPDRGWSSPVVWGKQIWMTTATPDGHTLRAVAADRDHGTIIHDISVFEVERPQPIDPINSYASPSPVIEKGRVYVHFGTYGTACLDTRSGSVLWSRRDFPVDHQKGPGSSPVLCKDLLIFQCDGNDVQYMVALNTNDGSVAWKTKRSVGLSQRAPDFRKSFSTPLVLHERGQEQIVSTAAGGVYGYEARTGRELWRVQYAGHTNIARPVAGGHMVFINTGYPKPELWGVRLGGAGDVTATHVAWTATRNVPIKSSPVLVDDLLYQVSDSGGIVTCLEAETGETVWQHRLGGNYAASPLVADGRIYFFSEEGKTTVIPCLARCHGAIAGVAQSHPSLSNRPMTGIGPCFPPAGTLRARNTKLETPIAYRMDLPQFQIIELKRDSNRRNRT